MGERERAPAFQCYPADVLTDHAGMSHEQFGMHWRLSMYAWRERGLPDDLAQLARLLGVPRAKLERHWDVIGARFERRGDRLVLPWQEEERDRQAAFRARQSENGRRGGRSRADRIATDNPPESDGKGLGFSGLTQAEPRKSSASASASASARTTSPALSRADATREALPPEFRPDFDALLGEVPNPDAWRAEIGARLSGLHPPAVSAEAMGMAIREYRQKGASRDASPRQFKRFIAGAVEQLEAPAMPAAPSVNGHRAHRGGAGQRTFHNAVEALRDV